MDEIEELRREFGDALRRDRFERMIRDTAMQIVLSEIAAQVFSQMPAPGERLRDLRLKLKQSLQGLTAPGLDAATSDHASASLDEQIESLLDYLDEYFRSRGLTA